MTQDSIVWHDATVTRRCRETMNGHRTCVLWFTGLSGSGKSTLAHAVEKKLHDMACRTFVLDGDNVRHGLSSDLGFGEEDRKENIRRIGEVAKLMMEAGTIAMTAFISPFRRDREMVRGLLPHGDFLEVFCSATLAVCEARDVKGLYRRARAGEIKNYTGIDSPYEPPISPELEVDTGRLSIDESVLRVLELLRRRGVIGMVTALPDGS